MTSASQCEKSKQVFLLFHGNLTREEQESLGEHICGCANCQDVYEKIASNFKVPNDVQQASAQVDDEIIATILSGLDIRKEPEKPNDELGILDPTDAPNCIGRIASYEVLELIGHGSMGVVYKAIDAGLNRFVAIKVMRPEIAMQSAARRRFFREAQAAAAVNHPNVVAIHAVEDSWRLPFLVMEFIQGQTLSEKLLRDGPLRIEEVMRIGRQIAEGLAAAHQAGLVHRDMKPANVMLENGVCRVKLADFGLARAKMDPELTETGAILGTPRYMAPEQARSKTVDYRADLFSVGCMLHEMCTGATPFHGDDTLEVLRNVCEVTPPRVDEIDTKLPGWLAELIAKLMEKSPDDRLQSAEAIADVMGEHMTSHSNVHGTNRRLTSSTILSMFRPVAKKPLFLATAVGLLICFILFFDIGPRNLNTINGPSSGNLEENDGEAVTELATARVEVTAGEGRFVPLSIGSRVDAMNARHVWHKFPAKINRAASRLRIWQMAITSEAVAGGKISFRAETDGIIYIAVTDRFGGGGGGGDWELETITREEMLADGWKEYAAPMISLASAENHEEPFTVYRREVKAGEAFEMRTEKYIPPLLITSHHEPD